MTAPRSLPAAPDLPGGASHLPRVIAATVVTGAGEIRYRRAGRGRPVLLLTARGPAGASGALVLHALAGRFRVIAPQPRPAPGGVGARAAGAAGDWIGHVVDGLGLERPSLVADEAFGLAALRFALLDPERVDRLVVMSDDRTLPAAGQAASCDDGAGARLPLLLVPLAGAARGPGPSPGAVAAMLEFLGPPGA